MSNLPLPQRKAKSWPHREWEKSLIIKGLNERPEDTIEHILVWYRFIRRHHWHSYRRMIEIMRKVIDGPRDI